MAVPLPPSRQVGSSNDGRVASRNGIRVALLAAGVGISLLIVGIGLWLVTTPARPPRGAGDLQLPREEPGADTASLSSSAMDLGRSDGQIEQPDAAYEKLRRIKEEVRELEADRLAVLHEVERLRGLFEGGDGTGRSGDRSLLDRARALCDAHADTAARRGLTAPDVTAFREDIGKAERLVAEAITADADGGAGSERRPDPQGQGRERPAFTAFHILRQVPLPDHPPAGGGEPVELGHVPAELMANLDLSLAVPDEEIDGVPFVALIVSTGRGRSAAGANSHGWEIRYLASDDADATKAGRKLAVLEARGGKLLLTVDDKELPAKTVAILRRSVLLVRLEDPDDGRLSAVRELRFVEPVRIGDIMIDALDDGGTQVFRLPVPAGVTLPDTDADSRPTLPTRSLEVVVETSRPGRKPERHTFACRRRGGDCGEEGVLEDQWIPSVVQVGPDAELVIDWRLSPAGACLFVTTGVQGSNGVQFASPASLLKLKAQVAAYEATLRQAARSLHGFAKQVGRGQAKLDTPLPFSVPGHETYLASIQAFLRRTGRPSLEDMEAEASTFRRDLAHGVFGLTDYSEAAESKALVAARKRLHEKHVKVFSDWQEWYLQTLEQLSSNLRPYLEPTGEILRIVEINSLAVGDDGTEYQVPLVVYDRGEAALECSRRNAEPAGGGHGDAVDGLPKISID